MICSGHVPSYRLNHLQFLRVSVAHHVYSTIQFKTPRRRGWHAGGRGRMNRHRVLEKKVCCVPRIRIHLFISLYASSRRIQVGVAVRHVAQFGILLCLAITTLRTFTSLPYNLPLYLLSLYSLLQWQCKPLFYHQQAPLQLMAIQRVIRVVFKL